MNEFFNISNFLNLLQTLTTTYKNSNETIMKREEPFNIDDYNIENNNVLCKCLNILKSDDEWKYLFGIGKDLVLTATFGRVNIYC
ncbi:hypothetical protein PIROE2DRAFT_5054 [Piromyces sp. E2]|nr:hypothetical protein PIROE2DRAFT_5054 [Piromyces sp. E2]|eukprot:OUM67523.1 hypothetical protein PIROE2DRAFT_5054 [Piromyces sp. E2]